MLHKEKFTIKGARQHLKDKAKQPIKEPVQKTEQIKNINDKVIKLTAADLKTLKRIQKGLKDLLNLIDDLK